MAVSAVLVGVCASAAAIAWAVSRETRVASSVVRGALEGVVLDAGDGEVEVVGGGGQADLAVRRSEHSAFGHRPEIVRELRDGVLRLRGRCPAGILTDCAVSWRLVVPDNVPVTVRTDGADVAVRGLRGSAAIATDGGDVSVSPFCGFGLDVRTESGDVQVGATCAPERLSLRSRTGDVRAGVPPGRYRVEADSDTGTDRVQGVTPADDAPFQLLVLSDSGDAIVEGRR